MADFIYDEQTNKLTISDGKCRKLGLEHAYRFESVSRDPDDDWTAAKEICKNCGRIRQWTVQ